MIIDTAIVGAIRTGFVAGTGDGIVTVRGQPAMREIYLLHTLDLSIASIGKSLPNGHYIFMDLELSKEYLVMVRDYKKEYEPFVWDCVKPADNLTVTEQQALWASWQTN